jgi:thioredoxin 1
MQNNSLPKHFEELLKVSEKPVLVDFWAAWCGPCKMVSPSIEKLAKEYKGRLTTVKVNVDEKQHIAAKYQIQSIPTIMMFWEGEPIMRLQGALPYDALKDNIEEHIPQ